MSDPAQNNNSLDQESVYVVDITESYAESKDNEDSFMESKAQVNNIHAAAALTTPSSKLQELQCTIDGINLQAKMEQVEFSLRDGTTNMRIQEVKSTLELVKVQNELDILKWRQEFIEASNKRNVALLLRQTTEEQILCQSYRHQFEQMELKQQIALNKLRTELKSVEVPQETAKGQCSPSSYPAKNCNCDHCAPAEPQRETVYMREYRTTYPISSEDTHANSEDRKIITTTYIYKPAATNPVCTDALPSTK
jgi:hypothetical protein